MVHQVKKTIDSPTVIYSTPVFYSTWRVNKLCIITYQRIARGKLSLFKESLQLLPYLSRSGKFGYIAWSVKDSENYFLLDRFVFLLVLIRILFDVIIAIILSDFLQGIIIIAIVNVIVVNIIIAIAIAIALVENFNLLPLIIFLAISIVTRSIFFLL